MQICSFMWISVWGNFPKYSLQQTKNIIAIYGSGNFLFDLHGTIADSTLLYFLNFKLLLVLHCLFSDGIKKLGHNTGQGHEGKYFFLHQSEAISVSLVYLFVCNPAPFSIRSSGSRTHRPSSQMYICNTCALHTCARLQARLYLWRHQ